mgnify:FL=1
MIITIVGPTGVGKSKLSIELAKKYNAVIINADQVQMYKYFNIGTAKTTEKEMDGIKHFLIDFLEPETEYTIYNFQKEGRKLLDKFIKENKNVVIVGGSGLYIKALLYDYELLQEDKNNDLNLEKYTNQELKSKVDKIYKDNNIHVNNRKRLIRFLEKYHNTGKVNDKNNNKLLYNCIFIGLYTSREKLYNIINNRVEDMFKNGLLKEAENLKKHKKSNEIIGYKELNMYFSNKISLEEAKEKIKQNSRRYAKRQYTWFKNQMDIKWFNVDYENINNTVLEIEDYIKESE